MSRKSNFELMRIISMFMIIVWHLLRMGGIIENSSIFLKYFLNFLSMIIIVHVNSFILLSGYFSYGKKFSFNKFLKLINLTWFYKIVALIIAHFIFGRLSTLEILKNLSPINYNDYWFLATYILLYLISPLLNKIINNIDQKTYKKYLLVLFCIISILPTITQQVAYNNSYGYSLGNFILLYFIGAYLKLYPIKFKITTNMKRILLITIFFSCAIVNFLFNNLSYQIANLNSVMNYISKIFYNVYCYDNPLVIIQTVAYFMFFETIDIKDNKIINSISKTTLGVYLIHTNKLIRGVVFKYFGYTNYMNTSLKIIFFLFVHSIALFTICSIIDYTRMFLFYIMNKIKIIKVIKQKLKKYMDSFGFDISW